MKERIHALKEENNDLQTQLQQLKESQKPNDECTGSVAASNCSVSLN